MSNNRPSSTGVFGVERPVSRNSMSSSSLGGEGGNNEDYASNKYFQLYYQIQRYEDNDQLEDGLRLRWEALSLMMDEGLLHTNPTSLAADADEYIRRVNFAALIHINKRCFRDAERLLKSVQQLVIENPQERVFNEAIPQLKSTKRRCLAVIENNMGLCDYKAGRFQNAEVHFFTAASMEEEIDGADNPGVTLFNLARVQQALGKHSNSLDCAVAATEHLRAKYRSPGLLMVQLDEARQLLVHALALQADAATSSNRFATAMSALTEAITIASEGHQEESASLVASLKQQRSQCDILERRYKAKQEMGKKFPRRTASEDASRHSRLACKRPINEKLAPYLIREQVVTSCLPNDGPLSHRPPHQELSNHNYQLLQRRQKVAQTDDASLRRVSTPKSATPATGPLRTASANRAAKALSDRRAERAASSTFGSYINGTSTASSRVTSQNTIRAAAASTEEEDVEIVVARSPSDLAQPSRPPLHVPTRPRSATTNTNSGIVPANMPSLPQLSNNYSSADRYLRSRHSNAELLQSASEVLLKGFGQSSPNQEHGSSSQPHLPEAAPNAMYLSHQTGLKSIYNSLGADEKRAFDELSKVPVRSAVGRPTVPLVRSVVRPATAAVRTSYTPKEPVSRKPHPKPLSPRRPQSATTSRAESSAGLHSPISNREGSLSKVDMNKKFMKLTQSDAAYQNALEHHKHLIAVDIVHTVMAGYRARIRCAITKYERELALSRLKAAIRAEVREEERVSANRVTSALVASRNIRIAQLESRLEKADEVFRAEADREEILEATQRELVETRRIMEQQANREENDAQSCPSSFEEVPRPSAVMIDRDIRVVQAWMEGLLSQRHTRSTSEDRRRRVFLDDWSNKKRNEIAWRTLRNHVPQLILNFRLGRVRNEEELTRGRFAEAEQVVHVAIRGALERERARICQQERHQWAVSVLEQYLLGWSSTQRVGSQVIAVGISKMNSAACRIQRFMPIALAVAKRRRLHAIRMNDLYLNKHHFAAAKIQSIWRMFVCYTSMVLPLQAHSERLQAEALAEAKRLRQIASIPVIQRAYRCHLARRRTSYALRGRQAVKMKYIADQMRTDAVEALQRFARIVRAKGAVRRQRYVMSNILRYREYQRCRLLEEECSRRTAHVATTLLQRCGRGAHVRWALRRYRVQVVEGFDEQSSV